MKEKYRDATDLYLEHIANVVERHSVCQYLGLNIDVMKLQSLYYDRHKNDHGSGWFQTETKEQYNRFMNWRYLYIECSIDQIIESKLNYQKKKH